MVQMRRKARKMDAISVFRHSSTLGSSTHSIRGTGLAGSRRRRTLLGLDGQYDEDVLIIVRIVCQRLCQDIRHDGQDEGEIDRVSFITRHLREDLGALHGVGLAEEEDLGGLGVELNDPTGSLSVCLGPDLS